MAASIDEVLGGLRRNICIASGRHDMSTVKIHNPRDTWYSCHVCGLRRHVTVDETDINYSDAYTPESPRYVESINMSDWLTEHCQEYWGRQ